MRTTFLVRKKAFKYVKATTYGLTVKYAALSVELWREWYRSNKSRRHR